MVKIYTPYGEEKPPRIPNNAGSETEPQYAERYDERGNSYLEKVGEVNTYEKIQSYKDECDVMSILSRYAAGDESALAAPGWYIDTSRMPESYTEYLNMMNRQKEKFNTLPLDIRQRFNNSFDQWMATAGEESWFNNMGFQKGKPIEKSEPEGDAKE